MKRVILSLATVFAITVTASAQEVALKSNLLTLPFGALNIGAEFTLGQKWTLATDVTLPIYNIWGDYNYNNLLELSADPVRTEDLTPYYNNGWMALTELRYWFCEAFNKHHIGLYAGGARYGNQEAGNKFFGIFMSGDNYSKAENVRAGFIGLSYGYYIKFFHGWGMDLYLGAGATYAKYNVANGGVVDVKHDSFKTGDQTLFTFHLMKIGAALSYKF